MRTLSLWLIIAGFAVVIAVFALVPGLDLYVTSHYFFDEETKRFWLAAHPVIVSLRNLNSAIDIMIGAALVFAAIYLWLVPNKRPPITRWTGTFLILTYLLAPVLIANGIFKENWGRWRPYHVTEFGGPQKYVNWWDTSGTCERNCSFFSGEAASAAWKMAPAVLVPGPLGAVAVAGAVAFPFAIAVVRMAQGGHFFSDTLFGMLFAWLTVWIVYGYFYPRNRRK